MAPSINYLGRTKIGQLLAAIGSKHTPDPSSPQAASYDWRDPHYFSADHQNRLAQALGQVTARMAEILTRARNSAFEVSLKTLTQRYAGDFCRSMELDRDYCLTFAPDKAPPCGFVSITPQTTMAWVTWLLGDTDSARDPNRALSPLEESLLSDLLTSVLQAFLAPLRAAHNLQPAGPVCQGQPNLQYELTEEIARVVFQVKSADAGVPSEITFVLPCSRLAVLAGKTATTVPAKVTPQELSYALMEHLQQVPVTVRATLTSTSLTFQEILDLGPGDILLLDKPVDGPAELIVNGHTVFRGRPARAQGQYAVVILESEAAARPSAPKSEQQPTTTKASK
jgi:flagellar motor switch protein FliM